MKQIQREKERVKHLKIKIWIYRLYYLNALYFAHSHTIWSETNGKLFSNNNYIYWTVCVLLRIGDWEPIHFVCNASYKFYLLRITHVFPFILVVLFFTFANYWKTTKYFHFHYSQVALTTYQVLNACRFFCECMWALYFCERSYLEKLKRKRFYCMQMQLKTSWAFRVCTMENKLWSM